MQKRDLQGKKSNSKNIADPIIVHPEIRKNLLHMKSLNEGIRALTLWVGSHFDILKYYWMIIMLKLIQKI